MCRTALIWQELLPWFPKDVPTHTCAHIHVPIHVFYFCERNNETCCFDVPNRWEFGEKMRRDE